jgi:hypothetical protein
VYLCDTEILLNAFGSHLAKHMVVTANKHLDTIVFDHIYPPYLVHPLKGFHLFDALANKPK